MFDLHKRQKGTKCAWAKQYLILVLVKRLRHLFSVVITFPLMPHSIFSLLFNTSLPQLSLE